MRIMRIKSRGQRLEKHHTPFYVLGLLSAKRLSMASINIPVMEISGKAASISRTQVGLVTLISVKRSPIISNPTKIKPFASVLVQQCGQFPNHFHSMGGLRHGHRQPDCHGFHLGREYVPDNKAQARHQPLAHVYRLL